MAQPTNWLGPFIEDEVKLVIAWKHSLDASPQVKKDPDTRFVDDGSNFRSYVEPPLLPPGNKVQISKILMIEDPVTVLITDGTTRAKAKLSDDAVAVLESEAGEKVDLDMKGDVFEISSAIVWSTPYGPSDGHIQLAIDRIEYRYHLRKPIGQPSPIEQRPEIVRLIAEITRLRDKQYASTGDARWLFSDPPTDVHPTDEHETPKSQRSIRGSQHSPRVDVEQSPSTQRFLATQIPNRRKPHGPSLTKDGFEIEDGVNLARPIQRGAAITSQLQAQPAIASGTGAKLLSLLGKRKAEEPPQPAQTLRPGPTKRSRSPMQVRQLEIDPEALQIPYPSSKYAPPARVERSHPPVQVQQQDIDPEALGIPYPSSEHAPLASVARPVEQRTPPSGRIRKDYSRRKIPKDQKTLLDQRSSWLPSLPGQRFPRPNVPIEMLKRWNAQVTADAAQKQRHAESREAQGSSPAGNEDQAADDEMPANQSEESSSSESSEGEPFTESQWPHSPSQRQPRLPPDSTMQSKSQPSPNRNQMDLPPDSSNGVEPNIAIPTGPRRQSQPKVNSASPRTPIPLPNRPDWIPQSSRRSAPNSATARASQIMNGQDSRPSTAESRQSNMSSHASFMRPSPKAFKRSNASPKTVVKATQFSPDGGDDIEMGVPRSLGQDPAVVHRQRRSEHFRPAQRRDWIKSNTLPALTQPESDFSGTYSAYKKTYPTDQVKLSEFAEAIRDVYPTAEGTRPQRIKLKSPKAAENVESISPLPPTPIADLDGAVETPGAVSVEPMKSNMQQESDQVEASGTQSSPFVIDTSEISSSLRQRIAGMPQHRRSLPWKRYDETPNTRPWSSNRPQLLPAVEQTAFKPAPSSTLPQQGPVSKPLPQQKPAAQPSTKFPMLSSLLDAHGPVRNSSRPASARGATSTHANDGKGEVFAEFTRAWKNVKPGGAFAEADGRRERWGRSTKVNVLSWGL